MRAHGLTPGNRPTKWGSRRPPRWYARGTNVQFGNLFGGERFNDLIGELSLIRDFSKASEIMMSDEEREELERQMREHNKPTDTIHGEEAKDDKDAREAKDTADAAVEAAKDKEKEKEKGKAKMTPEQREKLEAFEKEKAEKEKKRIEDLTQKLKDRIRPFVEAKNPGDPDDSATLQFTKNMKEEAEDLKLESFGVELLHTIGSVYLSKSNTWLKTKRGNFLGMPGFWSRMKERGGTLKEMWGVMGSAINVQTSVDELARAQDKGDISEEEIQRLEQDMQGKMLLATWRGTRWEVTGVLRQVVDNVLNEKGVSDKVLFQRARGIAFLGAIYKQVEPDESDDERRELERLVAQASEKKKKKKDRESRFSFRPRSASRKASS